MAARAHWFGDEEGPAAEDATHEDVAAEEHRKIMQLRLGKLLEKRREAFGDNGGIDWGHAEALAFASLVRDTTPPSSRNSPRIPRRPHGVGTR